MTLFSNPSWIMSFLCSNPDGLPSNWSQSQRLFVSSIALKVIISIAKKMIQHPLISNFFLPTCSLYISYTSLPCVLLNSCLLTFLRGFAPQIAYVPNTLPMWLPSISPSILYSHFIFFVRRSSFPGLN